MNPYEVVEAKTAQEALDRSKWQLGDLAKCTRVRVELVAGLGRTWGVFPVFDKVSSACNRITKKGKMMGSYRKKPIVIEAFQMTEERRWNNSEWPNWLNEAWQKGAGEGGVWIDPDADIPPGHQSAAELVCGTLEGVCRIGWGDWIIQGMKGEIYPCKAEIFDATYEPVEAMGKDGDA